MVIIISSHITTTVPFVHMHMNTHTHTHTHTHAVSILQVKRVFPFKTSLRLYEPCMFTRQPKPAAQERWGVSGLVTGDAHLCVSF